MEANKKILLATSNQGKLKEFKKLFSNFNFISQVELGINDAIEDGLTFFENATPNGEKTKTSLKVLKMEV